MAWIAGTLLNYKDDKKGLQDTFNWWIEIKKHLSFPDTLNIQYGMCSATPVQTSLYPISLCERFKEKWTTEPHEEQPHEGTAGSSNFV